MFAAPVAIKIVADGIRGVSAATVEAATALGSTRWQVVRGVQLPMAGRSLALAANQGVVYVLSMVVVGGLVGAGALGYDVVAGFSQGQLYGKGLAAGLAIVLLGTVLDRVTQAAARRAGPSDARRLTAAPPRWPSGRRQPGRSTRPRSRGSTRDPSPCPRPPSRSAPAGAPAQRRARGGPRRRPGRLRRRHRSSRPAAARTPPPAATAARSTSP